MKTDYVKTPSNNVILPKPHTLYKCPKCSGQMLLDDKEIICIQCGFSKDVVMPQPTFIVNKEVN